MYPNNRYQPRYKKQSSQRGWLGTAAAVVLVLVAVVAGGLFVMGKNKDPKTAEKTPVQTVTFDKSQFSLTDPTSPWLVVNKKRPLSPKTYEPADLTTPDMPVESDILKVNAQTAAALKTLADAADKEGIELVVASAYRSYNEQVTIYESMVRGYGQAEADRQSARPGHSEHQTGWAADLGAENGKCRIETCFSETPEGKWLAANSYKYGFIIRYPEGKEQVTGYQYEPWHVRFVGKDLAAEMHRTNTPTLEEFFSFPAATTY